MSFEDASQSGGVVVDPITSLTHYLFDMKLSIESYTEPIDTDSKNFVISKFAN